MVEDLMARMNDIQKREQVLEEFNASTLDDLAPLGGDQGMAVLNEMNDLDADHDVFEKSLAPRGGWLRSSINPLGFRTKNSDRPASLRSPQFTTAHREE